jgi:hypothetical protein
VEPDGSSQCSQQRATVDHHENAETLRQCCPTFLYIGAHLTDGCGGAGAVWIIAIIIIIIINISNIIINNKNNNRFYFYDSIS